MALHRGEYDTANDLAEASKLAPSAIQGNERVGAESLICTASLWAGHLGRAEERVPQLLISNPTEDIEQLLLANAIVGYKPGSTLDILRSNQAIERTPVGVFIAAQATYMLAVDSRNREKLNDAMDGLQNAQFLLRDWDATIIWRTLALTLAIHWSRIDEREADTVRFEKEGRPLVQRLDEIEAAPWVRSGFYEALGDEDGVTRTCSALTADVNSDFVAVACLMHGDYPAAQRRLDQIMDGKDWSGKYARLARAHVERGQLDGDQKVRDLVTGLLEDPSSFVRRRALAALCLACSPDEVEAYAQKAANIPNARLMYIDDLWKGEACVRYYAGSLTADELVEAAGNHGYTLANVHCTIAMKCLAQRDRNGALKHFQKIVDTETFQSADFELPEPISVA